MHRHVPPLQVFVGRGYVGMPRLVTCDDDSGGIGQIADA